MGTKICKALEYLVISRWDAPKFILTDNDIEFINLVVKAFVEERNITRIIVPPYHPQANPIEKVNRVLKTMIVSFIEQNHRKWDKYLSEFCFAYKTAFHSSLGTSSAFLNLGRELESIQSLNRRSQTVTEVESRDTERSERMKKLQFLREWVTESLDQAQRQSARYNLRRRTRFSKWEI